MPFRIAENVRKATIEDEYHVRPSRVCTCLEGGIIPGSTYHSHGLTPGCKYRIDFQIRTF